MLIRLSSHFLIEREFIRLSIDSSIHPTIFLNVIMHIKHLEEAFHYPSVYLEHNSHPLYVNCYDVYVRSSVRVSDCPAAQPVNCLFANTSFYLFKYFSNLTFLSPDILVFAISFIHSLMHLSVRPSISISLSYQVLGFIRFTGCHLHKDVKWFTAQVSA